MTLPALDIAAIADAEIPAVLTILAAWQAQLGARLLAIKPATEPEALLTVEAAAAKLSVKPDWLYRHGKQLGIAVKLGDGTLRFSIAALDEYIRKQAIQPVATGRRRRKPSVDSGDRVIS
jgi:hypothetical protein